MVLAIICVMAWIRQFDEEKLIEIASTGLIFSLENVCIEIGHGVVSFILHVASNAFIH